MTQTRDLPLDADPLDVITAHYASSREDERKASESAFVFRIAGEWLALPTQLLDRVSDVPTVHSLPHRRGGTPVGLVTVGGDLVVHMSLAALLGVDVSAMPPAVEGPTRVALPRLAVLADARGRLAITVDEVWGVLAYDAQQLGPVPSTLSKALVAYTTAMLHVEGRSVGYLDAPRVMTALSNALT